MPLWQEEEDEMDRMSVLSNRIEPVLIENMEQDIAHFFELDASNHTTGNITDVLCANCLDNPNSLACIRSGAIGILGLITALTCLYRIGQLHATSLNPLKLTLYYCLMIHSVAGSFEWLIGWSAQLSLFTSYTKALQLLIICYFYLDIASSMMHWSSTAGRRLCFSALFLMFTYFTAFLALGFYLSIEPRLNCRTPLWIYFSAGQFAMVQLMVISFFLILRRMDRISAPLITKNNQRMDVMVLFASFEAATLFDLAYHISLYLLTDEATTSCSSVFKHDQLRYSLLKAPYDVISFIAPVWAIVYVFRVTNRNQQEEESDNSDSTRSSSLNRSALADVVTARNFRRRYRPLTQSSANERPVLHSQWRTNRAATQSTTGGQPAPTPTVSQPQRMRSSTSAPMIRRPSVSRSIVSSPLYSIPEELHGMGGNPSPPMLVGSLDCLPSSPFLENSP